MLLSDSNKQEVMMGWNERCRDCQAGRCSTCKGAGKVWGTFGNCTACHGQGGRACAAHR